MDSILQYSLFELQEPDLPWAGIFTPTAGLILFTGHRGLLPLGHALMTRRLIEGDSVVFVDGANFLDLPLITRLTREVRKDPREILEKIRLSRAFTVHQLEAVILHRLEETLQKHASRLCLISGLLDTFSDEEIPLWEATGILRRVMKKVRALADKGYQMVVLAPDPSMPTGLREGLLPLITDPADRHFSLAEQAGKFMLKEKVRAVRGGRWTFPVLGRSINDDTPG